MANPSAISRKDMREPDRFQVAANQAATWLAARKKLVAMVGGVAVLVVVVVGTVIAVQSSQLERAGKATSGLLALAAAPVTAEAPAADVTEKTFPTDDAKNKALVAEAEKIIKSAGVSEGTLLALLVQADAHLGLKEWDAAAAAYNEYLASAPKDDSLRFVALEDLGVVAEEKGDLAASLQAYGRMAKEAPPYADRADLDRARVLAKQGMTNDARQLLTKFGENHPKSALDREAAQQLQHLGAK